ncbi:MAG: polysaccharide deacetylase family protein [Leptolyngbyaceae cyanobacterium bins.302]|nr:polysaccharide deacetylase family protein [Leptolyngbyaceae cyanobacterium bins.302]
MTYSPSYHQPSYYQPSILELARQGNFQAIAYWINSILASQGIHVQTDTGRSGCLMIMVNFPRNTHPKACNNARQRLVRHICYRLWTLNSKSIREVRIMGRVTGNREILWRQTIRISTPANTGQALRRKAPAARPRPKSGRERQERFHLLRSFLLNRIAIVGFLFCYWVIYLETTGHQTAEQPSVAATPQEQVQNPATPNGQEKTAIAHARPQPQNLVFTVPPQFQGQIIHEATPPATAEKVVALTFDDGPWKQTTEQILDILKQNNIKSTFYFVGQAIQENPTLAKKVVEEGHAVGNHTWQHLMDDMDATIAAQEMGNAARLIYEATGGVRTYLMRPPGGNLTGELANYARQQGYMVTMWSADSHDYLVSAPLIVDNVLSNVKPGGIVLMHDGGGDRSATVEALPQIISALQRQGYKFVTVPELMELQAKWATLQPPPVVPGTSPAVETTPNAGTDPAIPDPTVPSFNPSPSTTYPSNNLPVNGGQPSFNSPSTLEPLQNQPTEIQPGSPAPAAPVVPEVPNADSIPSIPPSNFQENGAVPVPPSPLMQDAGAMPVEPETEAVLGYAP